MSLLSNAEILVRGEGPTLQGKMPAAAAQVIFTPMVITSTDAATGQYTFAVANGRVDGFVNRAVATTIGSGADFIGWGTYGDRGVAELPYEAAGEGSLEPGEILELEGTDYLDAAVTVNTAAGTELACVSGKWKAAEAGNVVQYVLLAQMTPSDPANVRIQIKRVGYYVKAA